MIYFDLSEGVTNAALLGCLFELGLDKTALINELHKIDAKAQIIESIDVAKEYQGKKVKITSSSSNTLIKFDEIRSNILSLNIDQDMKKSIWNMNEALIKNQCRVKGIDIENFQCSKIDFLNQVLYLAAFILSLALLKEVKVCFSNVYVGVGFNPITAELLKDMPVKISPVSNKVFDNEAAVFLKSYGKDLSDSTVNINSISYGVEKNCIIKAIKTKDGFDYEIDEQWIIECNIDDMNPEGYEYIIDNILKLGALDVYLTPIIMKKGRPAIKLTVLCTKDKIEVIKEKVFRETSSFGLRSWRVEKTMLKRTFEKVETEYGIITIKRGWLKGEVIKGKPEYEDCKRIAKDKAIPLNKVYISAIAKMSNLKKY